VVRRAPGRTRRRAVRGLAGLALLAALAGHAVFWYLPREHAAAPSPDDLPARLLAGPSESALWLPYPHQNLAALEGALGGAAAVRAWLAALGRVTGLPERPLPAFGPFPAPPARELAVAAGPGGRLTAAARVYPLLAGVARLAGVVAGNPWLAGGEVEAFGGRARVAWDGTLWTVTSGAGSETAGAESSAAAGEMQPGGEEEGQAQAQALAILRLGRPAGWLPPATYRLYRPAGEPGVLELATAGAERLGEGALAEEDLRRLGVLLALIQGRGGPAQPVGGRRPGMLLLLARREGEEPGLPPAAVVVPPGTPRSQRLRLPAEGLYKVLGAGLERAEAAGWEVLASDTRALAAAVELAAVLPRGIDEGGGPGLELWADPGRLHGLLEAVAGVMESVPLVERQEAARWRDWAAVTAPLGRFERARLLSASEPPALRLRLVSAPGSG
jgi:hypothetical protein